MVYALEQIWLEPGITKIQIHTNGKLGQNCIILKIADYVNNQFD